MQRLATVENILNNHDIIALQVDVEVLDDLDNAGGLRAGAVARNAHEIDAGRNRNGAHKVCHKDDRTLQNADKQQVFIGVIVGNFRAHALDHAVDVRFAVQNFLDIV